MKPQSEVGMPLIIEGSDLIEAKNCTLAVFFVLVHKITIEVRFEAEKP